jgi:hypothetical protein
VRELGGVHAQVQASAELQLAVRVHGITQADVREALWERRSLVKAWTLRGTLHIHPADELALWFAAQRAAARASPYELEAVPEWRDPAGVVHPALEPDEARAVRAAVRDALDGRCLLREELVAAVAGRVGASARGRLRSGFAFFFGELVQGPPQGAKITLARPDQWIDGWREVDEDEALREVCRRFLRAYGPARPADFREWFTHRALTPAQARDLFAALVEELEEVEVEGRRAHVLAGDTAFPAARPSVRLLPEYDVYVMGSREREHLVPEAVREQVAASPRGRYEGPAGVRFLLVDGVAAGLWERTKRGKRLELRVAPARRLTKAHRAELDLEAERLGVFTGLELSLTVG